MILDSSKRTFRGKAARAKRKHYAFIFALLLTAISFAFYSVFVKANIFNFYPTSCLGTWEKPENAQGQLNLDKGTDRQGFNENNSAIFRGGSARQIFCGGFETNQDNAGKIFKKAVLKFSWTMIDAPESASTLEQSEFEEKILELDPTEEIIVVPDAASSPSQIFEESPGEQATPAPQSTPTPVTAPATSTEPVLEPNLTSSTSLEPAFSPTPIPTSTPTESPSASPNQTATSSFNFIPRVFAVSDEVNSSQTATTNEPASTPSDSGNDHDSPSFLEALFERVIEIKSSPSVPLEFIPPEPESSSQDFGSQNPASPSLNIEPDAGTGDGPVPSEGTASPSFLEIASASQETNTASESADEIVLTASSLENFFEILYSTDGQNWNLIANVNRRNFRDLEIPLPISSWDELETFQIMINVLPSDHDLPRVFLDSIWVEAEYENPAIPSPTKIIVATPDGKEVIFKRLGNIREDTRQEIKSLYLAREEFVYRLADINKDGFDDFGVAELTDENNFAVILSGDNGKMLGRFSLAGRHPGIIVSIGDVDNDNFEDIAVLDPGYSNAEGGLIQNERGRIDAYSGRNSGILWTYIGSEDYQFQNGNAAMALLKNKNGDARLLVGEPGKSEKAVQAGAILVVDPANGKAISEYNGETADQFLGMNFAVGPDLNGDSWPEIALGERYQEVDGHKSAGQVRVISGRDFSTLSSFRGNPQHNGFVGIGVILIDDLNGDGIADLMIESREKNNLSSSSVIYIVSPTDGSLIQKIDDATLYEELRDAYLIL